ncbi:carbon monoxide dehydrogenase subunit G [Kribbella orskensis]|uniref:Carbon monoxide dehydrogenase subunit G n=1 Tax=Kribbella orskensis TaxID=2512216 RepID=A0ABY2BQV2_9ACTN|nr:MULTISPECIES: SRPBCC family protein [Kribbella]TCN37298.1 carbon monoxide dehydrogenase subunit G [Kribbella sp. VKM Ac-2500]TCO27794.1 carbon monoxide dehydrogenase subunit G [Kribbella orskensis]
MITIERVITVDRPVEAVFGYLADFETTTEWDPGTVRTVRVEGDGGPGTKYRNTSSFAGRETELEYVVQQLEPGRIFQLRGENKTVTALDTMTFRAAGGGTEVTYRAEFEFKGMTRLAQPLLKGQLKKLGDEAEQGMHDALQKL